MVNPLHGFITKEGRLFQEFDSEGKGIKVYEGRGILTAIFDVVFGKTERVSVAGDVISVDKESAERFFDRNKDLLEGKDIGEMSLKEKLLYLLKSNKKLPRNVLEAEAVGGEEGRNLLIGVKRQFSLLAQDLKKNGFEVTFIHEMISDMKEGVITIPRHELVNRIVSENIGHLEELTNTFGDERMRKFVSDVISIIQQKRTSDG